MIINVQLKRTNDLGVGNVATRSGVAISTLHLYEREGLIWSRRNSGNHRRYPREVLRRIAVIRAAQRVGIPLSSIKKSLDALPNTRTPTEQDWERLSAHWKADLDERISRLMQLRDRLQECIGCGCLSLRVCPLRNPGDILAARGSGSQLLLK